MTSGTPASASRPLRSDAERNRRKILQAAREVFARQGLRANLNDVAHHAGVGVGTVYRRFPDKESLVEALFEERVADMVALAEQCRDMPDPWEGIVHLLTQACAMHIADRGLREVVFGRSYGHDRVARTRKQLAPLTQQLIERARASGRLRADLHVNDIPPLMIAVISVGDFTKAADPDAWRRYLGVVLDGLKGARDEPTPLATGPMNDQRLEVAVHAFVPAADPLGPHVKP